jgi:hypothetical protein
MINEEIEIREGGSTLPQLALSAPKTKEMQEVLNHLVLGIAMWISVTITSITTLLVVQNPWCLFTLLIPFVYTMFPQIQKMSMTISEIALRHPKVKKEKAEKAAAKEALNVIADAKSE